MTTCALVGDVPSRVAALVKKSILRCKTLALGDLPKVDSDFLIVHVPPQPTDTDKANVKGWLNAAATGGVRVGLTSGEELSADLVPLLFDRSVHPVMPLNTGATANDYAVALFLEGVVEPSRPGDADVPIGRYYARTASITEYRKQRYVSLSSRGMQPFLQALQEAVHAMSVPFPVKGKLPPWNPNGALTRQTKLGPFPSLADVFRLHADQGKLFDRDHRDWSVPKLLVRGESGSGKTLVAELVHALISERLGWELPFVPVNCAGLTNRNLSHELFGAPEGVWTGAASVGDLARAGYGVAFLDEIGDLAPDVQRAMLTFLGDGLIRPTGIEPYPGFVRIVAATNRDISLLIEKQQFRNDLNQRFSLQVEIPPLRDRDSTEIEALIDFVALHPQRNPGLVVSHIAPDALAALTRHEYRNGNFRELETVVHDGLGRARRRRSKVLQARDLTFEDPHASTDREAYLIDVQEAPAGPYLSVTREVDLARVASLAAVPVLRTPDRVEFAVTREATFRYVPTGTGALTS